MPRPKTLTAEFAWLEAGDLIVFDAPKQAWFPDDGQPLDERFTARAAITSANGVAYEPAIGLRSADATFEVLERHA